MNSVSQSTLPVSQELQAVPASRPRTSSEWCVYFEANAARQRPIPWERGAEITPAQLTPIARSLQSWQLGETSDGRHLRAAAARHAERTGDVHYAPAIDLFIREEQRHGEMLGRFLDLAGVGRVQFDVGDRLFRTARYWLADMECWTTPVVMVETMALLYYHAIRRATGSSVLRAICGQILADEVPHLHFQCERLADLLRHRPPLLFRLTVFAHCLLFFVIVLLVWAGHRRAFRAGGYGWRKYWRSAWSKMNASWSRMAPGRYQWTADDVAQPGGSPATSTCSDHERPRFVSGRQ